MDRLENENLLRSSRTQRHLFVLFACVFISCCAGINASVASAENEAASDGSIVVSAIETYQLAPEDVLDIFVWEEDNLTRQVVVRPDGFISFPLAGELQAQGKTVKQLQAEITAGLQKYIPEAVVSVTVAKVAGYRVYIVGKVNNPGEFVLGSYVNVVQALTLADGVTPYAKKKDIKIVRRVGASERVFEFNYADVERGKNLSQNIILKSGDTIIVP